MKFTESWLRELVDFPVSIEDLSGQLTMAGLEVESVAPCVAGFTDVLIARVEKIDAHPDSSSLKVCLLDIGNSPRITVVCGADNVQVGQCYPLAIPGAILPGNRIINMTTVKGVVSAGMLCSGQELGLSDDSGGLFELADDASPGVRLDDYLALPDTLIEVSLTPNRGDCLGMAGLAREVSVLNNLEYKTGLSRPLVSVLPDTRGIHLDAPAACPLYCGRIIHDVSLDRKIPVRISERLRRSGVRSINPAVDFANYVMLEAGQPMHVFDNDTLQGDVRVRFARDGETLVCLDGETRNLTSTTLVIADDSGPIAMAGIIGGLATAVTRHTRSVFIESAWFNPEVIMGRARQYGLHTDASHRYERGVDPALPPDAIEKLSQLIIGVCGGRAGPVNQAINKAGLPSIRDILLRSQRVQQLLGPSIPDHSISTILTRLGFGVAAGINAGEWQVTVPSYRFDVSIEVDLIEEIARIHGYQNIAGTSPLVKMRMRRPDPYKSAIHSMTAILVARGYSESISYSFVDPAMQTLLTGKSSAITLLNPISAEMAQMRQSLWPGLIQALLYNINRQQSIVRLFETGKIYLGVAGREEIRVIGGVIYGNKHKKQWDTDLSECDFYDLKSDVEALLADRLPDSVIEFKKVEVPALHPGQSAKILAEDTEIGLIGMLHPALARQLSLAHPALLFQLEVDKITCGKPYKFSKISKYPSIKRDIAIIVNEDIAAADILKTIKMASSQSLINLELFDLYRGEGIDSGKKSLALGLTFQRSSSTLTDEEADVAISDILQLLQKQFGAKLRE